MFQSSSYANGKYIIIDSDFQEKLNDNYKSWIESFIEVYSKRNLNVAYNLVLCMLYFYKEYGDDPSNQISVYKENVKDFEQYIPEINKYLAIL